MTATPDYELLIVGAGPAGCAAAVMADSLAVSTVLVDSGAICSKIAAIPILNNVLGGFPTGAALAEKVADDVSRAKHCTVLLGERARDIAFAGQNVVAHLSSGDTLTARAAVLATGVAPIAPTASDWLAPGHGADVPQLTSLGPRQLAERSILVLGADRPLGTLLRAHPTLDVRVTVAHPRSDQYKTEEVGADSRITLLQAQHVALNTQNGATVAIIDGVALEPHDLIAANIGTAPVSPTGPFVRDNLGYCPVDLQDRRIHIAGDLRCPRGQRIMTAMGSGAEASLRYYYSQYRD